VVQKDQLKETEVPNVRAKASRKVSAMLELVERNISNGVWNAGVKIPTERELEEKFSVSRNTLRRALDKLEADGKIVRQVGRGTFVSDRSTAPNKLVRSNSEPQGRTSTEAKAGQELLGAIHGASPVEVIEVRLLLEPAAAELAAVRASSAHFAKLDECLKKMKQARDTPEYESWDSELHVTITAAARNDLLTIIYNAINGARHQPEWTALKQRATTAARRAVYQKQHESIVAALRARNAELARNEVTKHLRTVRENLFSV
jgi:DNA-binding FadR family transcriptional regulator